MYEQRALVFASVGLAVVSMVKAIEKAREGDSDWLERGLTSANAGLIAGWVAKADSQGPSLSFAPSQMAAFALSGYQLVSWALRHGREHADFPVAVILFVVALAAISSMRSTLNTADNAFKASGALADKVSARRQH